jgi:hypothetical protein
MALQRAARDRAAQMVRERRPVIEQLAKELCETRWVGGWVGGGLARV